MENISQYALTKIENLAGEFHDVIKIAVPRVIEWFEDSDWHVRLGAATTIGKLAAHGM
jgi:HEAT repeat